MFEAGAVPADRMLCRICGCALVEFSGGPRMLERIVDPIRWSVCASVFAPPRIVLLMRISGWLSLGAIVCIVLFWDSAGRVVCGVEVFFKADFRGFEDGDDEAARAVWSCETGAFTAPLVTG